MPRPKGLPKTGGRKAGTPNKATFKVRAVAQEHGEGAIATLVAIMNAVDTPPHARIAAANSLLDRGYGRPTASVELTGDDGGPIQVHDSYEEARILALTQRLEASIAHEKRERLQGGVSRQALLATNALSDI